MKFLHLLLGLLFIGSVHMHVSAKAINRDKKAEVMDSRDFLDIASSQLTDLINYITKQKNMLASTRFASPDGPENVRKKGAEHVKKSIDQIKKNLDSAAQQADLAL